MKVLIIVDMQNDFVTGALGTPEAQAIVGNIKWKLECARQNGDLVIFTRDTHHTNYLETKEGQKLPVPHCIKDTDGWQIIPELTPVEGEIIINKPTFGSLNIADAISNFLMKRTKITSLDSIDICGVCTDICVVSNALILKANYFNICDIYVDHQCCAGVTPESHEAALTTMKMCQINVI